MIYKIPAIILLNVFYASYIIKMIMLKRQNITGDVLGKGQKPKGIAVLEISLKCTTYPGAAVQFISVIWDKDILARRI